MRLVRSYLRMRLEGAEKLWVKEDGSPMSYWAAQSVFRRLKTRSSVPQVHAHLLRHYFAKKALANGVERAVLQDMLGHSTSVMTNRYLGDERKTQAAKLMPRYSPI